MRQKFLQRFPSANRGLILAGTALAILLWVFIIDLQLRPTPLTLTQQEQEYIATHPVIRVALDFEFQPLQYIDDRGKPAGMTYDFLRAIASKAGFHIETIPGTWEHSLERVKNGAADILGDATPTPQRRKHFAFSTPLNTHTTHLYVQEHVVDVNSLEDLSGRTVVAMSSTSSLDALDDYPGIKVIEAPVTIDQLRSLQYGTADAALGYDMQFRYVMFKNKVKGIKRVGGPISHEDGCLMVRKDDKLLLSILNKGIESLSLEERQRIEHRWMSETSFRPRFMDFVRKYRHYGYTIAVFILVMVLWNLYLQRRIRRQIRILKDSENRYKSMFDTASDSIVVLRDGRITDANQRCGQWLGHEREELIGTELHQYCPKRQPDGRPSGQAVQNALELTRTHGKHSCTLDFIGPGNTISHAEIHMSAFRTEQGLFHLAFSRDITQRVLAEQEIERQKAYFKQLFEHSPLGIAIIDTDGKIMDISNGFEELFGFSRTQAEETELLDIIVPDEYKVGARELTAMLTSGEIIQRETIRQRQDGSTVDVFITAYPIMIENERLGSYCIYTDISERKNAERKLEHQTLYDRLTGLPNRIHLEGRITHAMKRAQRSSDYQFALLYVDLDRFKFVNDSLGRSVGDQLIIAAGMRLKDTMRAVDTVSRVGGDEFTVLMEEDVTDQSAIAAAKRIQKSFRRSIKTGGHELHASTSIGIVMGPTGHDRADFMLRDAEIAMHQAKLKGKDGLEIFEPSMHAHAVKAMRLETELRSAVENKEFVVHYQPIISLKTGLTAGVEALVRWNHPERGVVYPDEFIPAAEESGLILPLGEQILRTACRDLMRWKVNSNSAHDLFMSVNLSARQFSQQGLAKRISSILIETGVDPRNLKLEITESVVMENVHLAGTILEELRGIGPQISIDDFGTGYSSLSYLHRFPVSCLKIDRSFVSRIGSGNEHHEIVRTIIQLANNLNMDVIAEGVEEMSHEALLSRLGCDFVQGYLYSRPVSAEGIPPLLQSGRTGDES